MCDVFFNHVFQLCNIVFAFYQFNRNHFLVQIAVQVALFIQDISDTAAHAGRKVLSGCAEDNDTAAGHILASMLTDTLDNGVSTGVSDTETLSCDTVDVRLTARCAVEGNVSDDDVFFRFILSCFRRVDNQFSAREAFSEVIVRIALKFQGQSFWNKCSEALSAGTLALYGVRIRLQRGAEFSGDLGTKNRSHGTIGVGDLDFDGLLLFLIHCRTEFL